MRDITSLEEHARVLREHALVVTDYYATWCRPCKAMHPIVEQIEREFPAAVFCRVNVEELEDLAFAEGVSAMPTFTFHVGGQRLDNSTVKGANQEALRAAVENLAREIPPDPEFMQETPRGTSAETPRGTSAETPRGTSAAATPARQFKLFGAAQANQGGEQPLKSALRATKASAESATKVPQPRQPRKFQRVVVGGATEQAAQSAQTSQSAQGTRAGTSMRRVSSMDEYQDALLEHEGLTVVDFSASWCGPCRQIAPMLESMAQRYAEQGLQMIYVDVDVLPELAAQLGVSAMPTFMIGRGTAELERFQGADSNYLEQRIQHWLAQG